MEKGQKPVFLRSPQTYLTYFPILIAFSSSCWWGKDSLPRVMGKAEHRTPNPGQMRWTTVDKSHVLIAWGRRRSHHTGPMGVAPWAVGGWFYSIRRMWYPISHGRVIAVWIIPTAYREWKSTTQRWVGTVPGHCDRRLFGYWTSSTGAEWGGELVVRPFKSLSVFPRSQGTHDTGPKS